MAEFKRGDLVRVSLDLHGVVRNVDRCCERDFVTVDLGFADDDPDGHTVDIPVNYVSRVEPEPVDGMIRRSPGGMNVAIWQGGGWETLHEFEADPHHYDDWPVVYTPEKP